MKKFYLIAMAVMVAFSISACKKEKKDDIESTKDPSATEQITSEPTPAPTEASTEAPTVAPTDEPIEEAIVSTAAPEVIQKEGWISINEATSLLRTFLGSYDSNGNEFIFGYESTINKDGKDYYNFRITTLISDESGTVHQSYYANYIVSTDGIDLEEY